MKEPVNIFWFRRDLRLNENTGLFHALKNGQPVLPIFIFDKNILDQLEEKEDKRVAFIHLQLEQINKQLSAIGSTILLKYGNPIDVWKQLTESFSIKQVFANHDYEPYAINRDQQVKEYLQSKNITFNTYKDQVIFEKQDIVKDDGKPYTVFTPYSKKWMAKLDESHLHSWTSEKHFRNFYKTNAESLISLKDIGFKKVNAVFPSEEVDDALIKNYEATRNFPAINGTSHLSVHLRFGTISIRQLARKAKSLAFPYLNELIWREFYQMILWHFPHIVTNSFKPAYDNLQWRNNETEFECWCNGETGYPMVDAGMRELNETGFMHNRLRMVTASFLTKHLLIDWRWGEAYFAKKLLDYELASNNGGWQWAAGTGCDAAPYFRIFNPSEQAKKFDPESIYIKRWIPELQELNYPAPIVEHVFARERCLNAYKAIRN